MRARPSAAMAAAVLSLCLLTIAACTGGSGKRLIPPPPTTVAVATSAPGDTADFSGVGLAPVGGRPPTEEIEVLGGEATLSGIVTGPEGPVAGAIVRLERFVGDASAKLDVVSAGDGTWRAPQPAAPPTVPTLSTVPLQPGQPPPPPPRTAPRPPAARQAGPQGIFGGRYRIRAWRTPDLALTTPQILFLEGKQNRNLGLQLSRYAGVSASGITSPDPPILGQNVTVTAIVTTASVDGEGVVRGVPLVGASVSLIVGSGFVYAGGLTGGPTFTNSAGRAAFQLRCEAAGQSSIELTVNNTETFALPVRPCVPPPTTTTSLPDPGGGSSTSSSIVGGTTSTSRGGPPTT